MPNHAVKKERVQELDWIKGMLVVFMVVYHSLNYSPYPRMAFQLLAFLPPSFIFITGFLISNSYLSRYGADDTRLYLRLIVRGAKLILLFTVLNLVILSLGLQRNVVIADFADFVSHWRELYLVKEGRMASYYILVPIGYLLLLAPVLLKAYRISKRLLVALATLSALSAIVLEFRGELPYQWSMVSVGIIGMAFGLLPFSTVRAWGGKWGIIVPAYVIYRICSYTMGEPYWIQLFGVLATLMLLFCIAQALRQQAWTFQQCVVLGKYSLFGYIFQLAALQVIARLARPIGGVESVFVMVLVTLCATWAATRALEKLRSTASYFDLSYRIVFT